MGRDSIRRLLDGQARRPLLLRTLLAVCLLVLIGIFVLMLMFGVGIYNRLVALRNRLENAFSQIEVQLKRRYDLSAVPQLLHRRLNQCGLLGVHLPAD